MLAIVNMRIYTDPQQKECRTQFKWPVLCGIPRKLAPDVEEKRDDFEFFNFESFPKSAGSDGACRSGVGFGSSRTGKRHVRTGADCNSDIGRGGADGACAATWHFWGTWSS